MRPLPQSRIPFQTGICQHFLKKICITPVKCYFNTIAMASLLSTDTCPSHVGSCPPPGLCPTAPLLSSWGKTPPTSIQAFLAFLQTPLVYRGFDGNWRWPEQQHPHAGCPVPRVQPCRVLLAPCRLRGAGGCQHQGPRLAWGAEPKPLF